MMNTLHLPLLAALLLASLTAMLVAAIDPQLTQNDVEALAERKIIAAPDYWREHLVEGGKCDGAKTEELLLELALVFKPITKVSEAIAVLSERGVIGLPEYWSKNAAAGRTCAAGNVAALLSRVARRLPIPPPKSASAAPLEPVRASALKGPRFPRWTSADECRR